MRSLKLLRDALLTCVALMTIVHRHFLTSDFLVSYSEELDLVVKQENSITQKPSTEDSAPFLGWRYRGLDGVDLTPSGRKYRFPSVEERIMFYMSSWYSPPCPTDLVQVNKTNSTTFYIQGPGKSTSDTTNNMTIDTYPICHKIFAVEQSALEDCAIHSKGNIKRTYCPELTEHILPIYEEFNDEKKNPPLLVQVGDMMMSAQPKSSGRPAWLFTTLPHLGKTRYVWKNDRDWLDIKSRKACEPRPTLNGHLEPIIWKLNRIRHYPKVLYSLSDEDIPWAQKKAAAIFRGIPTGDADRRLPPHERCLQNARCTLALGALNSTIVDAKLVPLSSHKIGRFDDLLVKFPSIEDKAVPIQGQLQYKGVIMVEGNDVSTGLKWALLSNSVVLMAKPTVSSWLMEEWLEPFVHYIPLKDDFSDVQEMTQWMIDNDLKAQQIANRGKLWMEDFLFHHHATKDETTIYKQIMARYRMLFQ